MLVIVDNASRLLAGNRLFVLGAGFSAGAGVPMTSTVLARAMDLCRAERGEFAEMIDAFARECFQIDGMPDYTVIDLAKFITYLEYAALRELGGGDHWSDLGSKPLLCIRYYLGKAIVSSTPAPDDIPDVYIKFVERLRPDRDLVVTFNWDCLLERAFARAGRPYSYTYKRGHVCIEKLHGSVNWRRELPKTEGYRQTVSWSALGFGEHRELYFSNELLDIDRWPRFDLSLDIQPMIVLPGFGKAYDVRAIAPLWYKKFEEWSISGDTYIIGKGVPEDDFFVRCWFLENLPYVAPRRGDLPRRVFIIAPGDDIRSQYAFALGNPIVEVIAEKFAIEHINLMESREAAFDR